MARKMEPCRVDRALIEPILFLGYVVVPFVVAIMVHTVSYKNPAGRPPVDFTLLRGPGESLRQRIVELDQNVMGTALTMTLIPWLAIGAIIWWVPMIGKQYAGLALVLAALVLLVQISAMSWWVYRHVLRRRNFLMGYYGERAVAEELDKLGKDYRVFHALPVIGGLDGLNLDHVVVGPTGLFVIETKTRRKGRTRKGFEAHKVFYDGRQLIWPWAEEADSVQQAMVEADWLSRWIRHMTGFEIAVRPVLALPGWWVETLTPGPVAVQNPKNLPSYILGNGERVLDDKQIDLIAHRLDSRCRDVND